jgi:hypothetical protein
MKLGAEGLQEVLPRQPGLYGVAVDSKNRIYVGLDLSDDKDSSGNYMGSVNRVEFDATGAASLKRLVVNIRRPRNLVVYQNRLYFILEAERVIKSIDLDEVTSTGMPTLREEFKLNIVESANGLAIYDGRFYWTQYGQFADPDQVVGGTIRSTSMANPGVITTVASGLGRTRGIGFDAAGNLYFTTESNAQDQGNSGVLGKVSPSGEVTNLIDNLDYPQFLAVSPTGSVVLPFCRENFVAIFHQDIKNVAVSTPYTGIELFGVGIGGPSGAGRNKTLTLSFGELGGSLNFPITLDETKGRGGWVTIPFDALANSLKIPIERLSEYSKELAYPVQPEVPAPGFFKKPSITCAIGGSPCTAYVLSRRTHVLWRWPMTGPAGHEQPPAGFSENPDAFLVNVYW